MGIDAADLTDKWYFGIIYEEKVDGKQPKDEMRFSVQENMDI